MHIPPRIFTWLWTDAAFQCAPQVFIGFVFSNFYPDLWTDHQDKLSLPTLNLPEEITQAAMESVHVGRRSS